MHQQRTHTYLLANSNTPRASLKKAPVSKQNKIRSLVSNLMKSTWHWRNACVIIHRSRDNLTFLTKVNKADWCTLHRKDFEMQCVGVRHSNNNTHASRYLILTKQNKQGQFDRALTGRGSLDGPRGSGQPLPGRSGLQVLSVGHFWVSHWHTNISKPIINNWKH